MGEEQKPSARLLVASPTNWGNPHEGKEHPLFKDYYLFATAPPGLSNHATILEDKGIICAEVGIGG